MPYADQQSPAAVACRRAAGRRYYHKNKERCRASLAKWHDENRDYANARSVAYRQTRPVAKLLFLAAQQRAKRRGVQFAITVDDVLVPERCPVLGFKLAVAQGHAQHNSPTIDRIDNDKGYVPGNIRVISYKANTIKNAATVDELRAVLAYMEGDQCSE